MEVILRKHPNLCMKQKNQKKEKNRRGRAHKVRKKIESFSPCFHFFIHKKKKKNDNSKISNCSQSRKRIQKKKYYCNTARNSNQESVQ